MPASQKRGPWTSEEDNLLLKLIDQHGAFNWVKISALLKSRSPKQCRERYHQNLKPSLNKTPISEQEGELIQELVSKIGKKWAEISRVLNNGRSDNAIKNWWNGGANKRKRAAKSMAARQVLQNFHQQSLRNYVQTHDQSVYVPVATAAGSAAGPVTTGSAVPVAPPPLSHQQQQQTLPPLNALTPNVSRRNSVDVVPQPLSFIDPKRQQQFLLYSPDELPQLSRFSGGGVADSPSDTHSSASFIPHLPSLVPQHAAGVVTVSTSAANTSNNNTPITTVAHPVSPRQEYYAATTAECHLPLSSHPESTILRSQSTNSSTPTGSREILYDTHDRNALCKLDFLLNKDDSSKNTHFKLTAATTTNAVGK
ncbi:uncharacterized protein Ecym_6298 [Eremothecium cymbalariae DBVPG|uniref:Uncharacterized protein n=1 Tax=Eremothecium cymbalariae (strain CBS 270.75 / DBVPG 7215 / KCTC 17166 / NRRL Y-17582) TaxID=931890 RepID=G8JU98_ERECY|nr:hypothetical protein Ecym_6298 [Eremothecium cymbalariae DBVPG\